MNLKILKSTCFILVIINMILEAKMNLFCFSIKLFILFRFKKMTNTSTNETNQDTFYNAIKTVFDNWTGYQVIIE